MKSLFLIPLALLSASYLTSCNESGHPEGVETETIDFCSLKQMPLSELQTDTAYLLLRSSSPEYLVGDVSKIEKSDGRYYLIDRFCKKTVVYDSLGMSIGSVGALGKGHLEYLRCHDLAADGDGNVYLSDGMSDKYIKYAPDLQPIEEIPANPEGTDILIARDGSVLVGVCPWHKGVGEGHSVARLTPEFKMADIYGEIGVYDIEVIFGGTGFANSGRYVSYVSPYEVRDDVMLFSPADGRLVKKVLFDFGDYAVPDNLKDNLEGNKAKIDRCNRIQDIFSVTDSRIVGRMSMGGVLRPFVIDRDAQILYLGDEVDWREQCSAYIDDAFVSVVQTAQKQYPDSVNRHVESDNTVLMFSKFQ